MKYFFQRSQRIHRYYYIFFCHNFSGVDFGKFSDDFWFAIIEVNTLFSPHSNLKLELLHLFTAFTAIFAFLEIFSADTLTRDFALLTSLITTPNHFTSYVILYHVTIE